MGTSSLALLAASMGHGHTLTVFTWRRQYQRGHLKGRSGSPAKAAMVLPVQVAELPRANVPSSTEATRLAHGAPRIEIELANGPRVKIWDIGSETLRALIRDLVRPC